MPYQNRINHDDAFHSRDITPTSGLINVIYVDWINLIYHLNIKHTSKENHLLLESEPDILSLQVQKISDRRGKPKELTNNSDTL